jgi:hypothetical protein
MDGFPGRGEGDLQGPGELWRVCKRDIKPGRWRPQNLDLERLPPPLVL